METAGSQERVIRYDAEALRAAALPLDSGQSVEMPFVLTARAKLCRNVAVSAQYLLRVRGELIGRV